MHDVGLRRVAVAHVRNVADVDHRAVDGLDRQISQRVDIRRRVVQLHRIFGGADLLGADGIDQVLRGKSVGDILRGKALRVEGGVIEINLNLPRFAAVRTVVGTAFRLSGCKIGQRRKRTSVIRRPLSVLTPIET